MLFDFPIKYKKEITKVMRDEKRTLLEAESITVMRLINSLKEKK